MFFLGNATAQIKQKRQSENHQGWGGQQQQGGWGQQQQGGWGGQQQGGWGQQQQGGWGGQQGGWGGQQQGGWGQQQQGGWGGQQQGGWGQQLQGEAMGFIQNQSQWGNNLNGSQWVNEQKKQNQFNIFEGGAALDISQVLGQQVIFLEPSPAKQKLAELQKLGQKFIDDRFPPNTNSLSGQYGPQAQWKQITWQKVMDKMSNPKIFNGKVEPGDIKQGYLGDCYFLAGLAALAERPDRIFNLFLLEDLNPVHYFSVKILYKGKWVTIDMDEYVPYLKNQPAFTKANDNQLWVILLEKAWAKLYTSYKRIEAGYPEEPLHDLTGAPIKQLYLQHATFNKEQDWKYLVEASIKQYSMVASSQPGSDTNKSMSGVVQGHAYTVLNATVINAGGQQHRIMQLRNPWGKGEFKGKWSDGDQSWNLVSEAEKKRVGYNPNVDDGIFFMPYDDFLSEFRAITIAEIDDNASYIYKSYQDKQCKGVYFSIQIFKDGEYSFQVDKTPERIYPDKAQEKFRYPEAQFEIGKINGNFCQKYQGFRSAKRTLFKKQQLAPGKYVAWVKIAYDPKFQADFDVNLAVYAPFACTVQLASRQQAVIFSGDSNVQWTGQDLSGQKPWNSQGNTQFQAQNNFGYQGSGWGGNQGGGWGNEGGNQGWGGNQGGGGWGNEGGNQGWGGNQGGSQGWGGNQGGGGWGNQGGSQGWGGNQGGNQQGGWGNQGGNQGGWGGNQGGNGW